MLEATAKVLPLIYTIKDRQLRENRAIAIDTGTEIDSKMTSVEERGNPLKLK